MNFIKTSLCIAAAINLGVVMAGIKPSQADQQTSQKQVRFYCGQSFDNSSQKILPTTFAATSERKDPVAIIRWKFGMGSYTPQSRCNSVSPKFQTAWTGGRLHFITAGTAKNGAGIICGVASRDRACDESTMLFTLKNTKQAQETIAGIEGIRGGSAGGPVSQSSGAIEPVSLDELLK